MSKPYVENFLIDEVNEEKFWRHGLTDIRVLQVLDNRFTIRRNRNDRRAPYIAVGTDHQGECIAIPIEETHMPGIWRPVTAWVCKDSERNWLP